MAATGNPYENATAESFFNTLKCEEVYLQQYETFAEAEAKLGRFFGDVYNTKRLHASLGYLPPVEFEAAHSGRWGGLERLRLHRQHVADDPAADPQARVVTAEEVGIGTIPYVG